MEFWTHGKSNFAHYIDKYCSSHNNLTRSFSVDAQP